MSKDVPAIAADADDKAVKLPPSLNPNLDRVLAAARERRVRGDPATYLPTFGADLIDVMGEGYSLTAFAGAIGFSRGMLESWCKRYPSFAVAVEQGRAARTRALETQFLTAGTGAKVAAHVFALKNAAPEDWREHPGAEAKGQGASVIMSHNGRDDPPAAIHNNTEGGDGQ